MNVSHKRAIATSIIFGILFVFLVVFFTVIGPDQFLIVKLNSLIASMVILAALVSFALMLLLTHKKDIVIDERDILIQKKASTTGLMVSLIYVFLLSMILFITYRNPGTMNVSWAWFIAYSTFAFGYFFTSLMHIYYYNYES